MDTSSFVVDFPTLWVAASWAEAHAVVPDGDDKGEPFVLTDWQLWTVASHYRIKPDAKRGQKAAAFHYRRSQIILSQKVGKTPQACVFVLIEALGPALFDGWAKGGEKFHCGCGCGWSYTYEPGEPMGKAWATPLIQLTAVSEDQVANTMDALRPMIREGPLADIVPYVGEEFIRLPNDGRIDSVTSNARSRLGQRVTFALQDESGLWLPTTQMVKVAETQRRGLAGMGGRAVETTNAYDPSEQSVAQRTAESRADDLFRFHPLPPKNFSYHNKRERTKIHKHLYQGSPWVDINAIDAEAAELYEVDPSQAMRFFGNMIQAGTGQAYDPLVWGQLEQPEHEVPRRATITIGIDGALTEDALAVVATEVDTGFQWPLCILEVPSIADDEYYHDLHLVEGVMDEAFNHYNVWRVYADPQRIETLIVRLQEKYGADRVLNWYTNRPRQMAFAVRKHIEAVGRGEISHDGDETFARHIGNAVKRSVNVYDDNHKRLNVLYKDRAHSKNKIDAAIAAIISWEAAQDCVASGNKSTKPRSKRLLFV